jgi:two-component system, OmpR family, response regulator
MAKLDQKIRIYSALEVANMCGVVNQTAINWIRSGYLKAFTTPGGQYRVYAEDLAHFLESRGMRFPDELGKREDGGVNWNSILVIDDDRDFNQVIKDFLALRFSFFEVIQAWDGFDAGRLSLEKRPGFLILDVNLPGIDGYGLCRKIKTEAHFGKPFIIAVTGQNDPSVRERIIAEGADAFFMKPVDFPAFGGVIADLYGRIRL